MVSFFSSVIVALGAVALLQPAWTARVDEEPLGSGDGSGDSFFDGLGEHESELKFESELGVDSEETKFRTLVFPQVAEAKQASVVASDAASRANEATQRAKQEELTAESALSKSKKQAAEAKAAMFQAKRSGLEAKASMVRAHLEQVEAVAGKKVHSLVTEADHQIKEQSAQADHNVQTIMHKAAVSIHTSHINADHRLKEIELGVKREKHNLEADAARRSSELLHAIRTHEESRIQRIQSRTALAIQEAEEAAFARVKRADETAERDVNTVRAENSAVLKAKTEHIIQLNKNADMQVKKQGDIADESLARIEANKQRTIERGRAAMELSLKDNKERADRKVKAQEDAVILKEKNTAPAMKDVHNSAQMRIQHNNDEADRTIKRAVATSDRKIKENVERYGTDSAQVARLRQNQVKERMAVSKYAAMQAQSVKKRMTEWDKEATAARLAFEKAAAVVRSAKEEADEAKYKLSKVNRDSQRNDNAVAAEMAAAAAQQKAKDAQMYAEKATALAQADQERVAQASTNPILLGGVPYAQVEVPEVSGSGSGLVSPIGSASAPLGSALLSEEDGMLSDWHAEFNKIHASI